LVWRTLDQYQENYEPLTVIQGGTPGADRWTREWAHGQTPLRKSLSSPQRNSGRDRHGIGQTRSNRTAWFQNIQRRIWGPRPLGRNPKTGVPLSIPETRHASFKTGREMHARLNGTLGSAPRRYRTTTDFNWSEKSEDVNGRALIDLPKHPTPTLSPEWGFFFSTHFPHSGKKPRRSVWRQSAEASCVAMLAIGTDRTAV